MNERIPKVYARCLEEIEELAQMELVKTNPMCLKGHPFPLLNYVEFGILEKRHHVSFSVCDLPPGVVGRLDRKELILDTRVFEVLEGGNGPDLEKARFTLAHEIGHAIMHSAQLTEMSLRADQPVLYKHGEITPDEVNPEWQANRFAEALLIPAEAVTRLHDRYKSNQSGGFGWMLVGELLVPKSAVTRRIKALIGMRLIDNILQPYRDPYRFMWGKPGVWT